MQEKKNVSIDIECLNSHIVSIDIDDLEIETLDQRIELSLAVLFGEVGIEAVSDDPSQGLSCGSYTCNNYIPPL